MAGRVLTEAGPRLEPRTTLPGGTSEAAERTVTALGDLADLHIHVGGAVAPHILWSIAHEQGFKLPVKTFFEFRDLVTASPNKVSSLGDYLKILHQWTEKIQSSPSAIERSCYEIIGKEYRSSRVSLIELRFNPMKRNQEGERDLDHIIAAALRGLDRACLEYGVKAGLIFCLAREFDFELNEIIVRKAERWRSRGIIGVDVAGPERHTIELGGDVDAYEELFARARRAGLGTTIHTGETASTGVEGVIAVIDRLRPSRIGHGIAAAESEEAMRKLVERDITLEICPTSNLMTKAVRDVAHLGEIFARFRAHGVPYTINTDGPYLLETNMRLEFELLVREGVLGEGEARACNERAFARSFIS